MTQTGEGDEIGTTPVLLVGRTLFPSPVSSYLRRRTRPRGRPRSDPIPLLLRFKFNSRLKTNNGLTLTDKVRLNFGPNTESHYRLER